MCCNPDLNLDLEEARRDVENWYILYVRNIPFQLPRSWSWNAFSLELINHRTAINGVTPLEALPRALTFLELLRAANEQVAK